MYLKNSVAENAPEAEKRNEPFYLGRAKEWTRRVLEAQRLGRVEAEAPAWRESSILLCHKEQKVD